MDNKIDFTRYVIFACQRTGSSFLGTAIRTHYEVAYHQELLKKTTSASKISYKTFREKGLKNKFRSILFKEKFMDEYLSSVFQKEYQEKAVGFKLMLNQFNRYPEVEQALRNNNFKVIRLIRKNHLKRLVSFELAMKTKDWVYRENDKQRTLVLNPKTLISKLDKLENENKKINGLFPDLPSINLSYEDITSGENPFKEVLSFLNVDPNQNLSSYLKKQTKDDLSEVIENYDEIEKLLSSSHYEILV